MTTAADTAGVRRGPSLSRQFTLTLLPLVVLPLLIMGGAAYLRSRDILRARINAQLSSAAEQELQTLTDWASVREERVQIGSQRSSLRSVAAALQLNPASDQAKEAVRAELTNLMSSEGTQVFSVMMLVRREDAWILASTVPEMEDRQFSALFRGEIAYDKLSTRPLYDDPLLAPGNLAIVTAAPMQVVLPDSIDTVLIGINRDVRLGSLMQSMQTFWEQRGIYRVEEGNTFVAMAPDVIFFLERYAVAPSAQPGVIHPVFDLAKTSPSGVLNYQSFNNQAVVGAYQWSPDWNMGVVLELPQSVVFADLNSLAPFSIALVAAAVLLAGLVVPWATRRSLSPLRSLTDFTEKFAAGELETRVAIQRRDEIGRLGDAFNKMAEDLSGMYRSLEERVDLRTRQIRTAAEVARDAAVIRSVDDLLGTTVNLISARFGHYHAGIFLIDEAGENAVLRAASSPGGKTMLERGHKLAVGKVGIVGYVTGTGKPRIALDVGADAVHFANPDLPKTRSEIALPLRVGDRIIGALDVQSTEANAFDENDAVVLQTMADQVAIALENARLLQYYTRQSSTRRSVIDLYSQLAERESYDAILRGVTDEVCKSFGYAYAALALAEGGDIVVRALTDPSGQSRLSMGQNVGMSAEAIGKATHQTTPVVDRQTDTEPANLSLGVALLSHGRIIGSLAVGRVDLGEPTDQDVDILQQLAGPLAATIENARLAEETQQSLQQLDSLYRQQTGQAWEQLLRSRTSGASEGTFETGTAGGDASLSLRTPIELRGETIGALDVLASQDGALNTEDEAVLQAVADELAGALEQARLMEEIRRRAVHLQAAAEVARETTGQLDLPTLLSRAVHLVHERFGYDHIALFIADETGRAAVLREAAGIAADDLKQAGFRVEAGATSIVAQVLREGRSYLASDVMHDPTYLAHPLLLETRSELAVPLRIGDQVIGVLDCQVNRPFAFTQDDVTVLEILADQVTVGIQNARLFHATLQRARREQAVVDVTSRIRASQSIDEILRTAVREMRRALGAQRALIWLNPIPSGAGSPTAIAEETPSTTLDPSPAEGADGGNGDHSSGGTPERSA
ncbi:MAG TPA: GAF domain-containing protein [Anaerolineales bacterium]|nr:GAF domain-containing protein [Anaerolineales bacterium]